MRTRKKAFISEDQLDTKYCKDNNITREGLYDLYIDESEEVTYKVSLISYSPNIPTKEQYKINLRSVLANEDTYIQKSTEEVSKKQDGGESDIPTETIEPRESRKVKKSRKYTV